VRALAARNPRVSVHVNSDRMAELMRDADLAIGAAGTTSWERCCLGLPAIVLVLAENQRLAAANLERAGAIALADSPEAISPLVQQLSGEAARLPMIAAAAAITDGEGAKLAAELMIGGANARDEGLKLRAAQPGDSRIAWLWRNDHGTRRFSQTTTPITWPRHEAWWRNALGSSDRQLLIAEVAGAPVAVVRFDRIADGEFEVSINLAPSARGSGLGARILAEACGKFVQDHAPVRLSATIHHDNPPSRRIFEKLGFVRSGALSNPQFEGYVLIEGQVA
jgi:RimJ/RimL family protein N-acetyltransferase